MALFDLVGRRWALRIVWELREGDATFRDLAHRCDDVSSSVLRDRLRDLTAAGIVERGDGGYRLTADGPSSGSCFVHSGGGHSGGLRAQTQLTAGTPAARTRRSDELREPASRSEPPQSWYSTRRSSARFRVSWATSSPSTRTGPASATNAGVRDATIAPRRMSTAAAASRTQGEPSERAR